MASLSTYKKIILISAYMYTAAGNAQLVTPADMNRMLQTPAQDLGGNGFSRPNINANQARELLQRLPQGGIPGGGLSSPETKPNPGPNNEPQSKEFVIPKPSAGASPAGRRPLKPNNFQLYLKQSEERDIPVFGAELFEDYNSFTALESQPVPNEYVIGPGDEILLKILGNDFDFEQRLTVDRAGLITIPKIGPLSIAGIKVKDIEPFLKARLSKILDGFSLHASMGRLRGIEVYVVGHARNPGRYTVSSVSSLINALFATGGPDSNGTMRNIQLVRNNAVVTTVDLYEFIRSGSTKSDARLLPGDIIRIPAAGPTVALLGVVPTEAVFELNPAGRETTLDDVLQLSGGRPIVSSPMGITFRRIDPSQSKPLSVRYVSADDAGLKTTLRDGDVVVLNPLKPAFDNAITLRILDSPPIRIPIGANTKVSEAIPSRDALLTPDYWQRRFNPARQQQTEQALESTVDRLRAQFRLDQINWEQAIIERADPQTLSPQIISFSLDKAINRKEPQEDKILEPGDIITVFSQNAIAVSEEKRVRLVQLSGEVQSPGVYQLLPGETLDKLVQRAGGVTAGAYLYGIELSRASIRIQQRKNIETLANRLEMQLKFETAKAVELNPEAARLNQLNELRAREQVSKLRQITPSGRIALEMNASTPSIPSVKLEDGDEIRVPQIPSSITAVGAVNNDNALIYRRGRKVSDYLRVAGLNEWAELDRAFIARADGTVVTGTEDRLFLFRSGIESLEIYPGDTIVVPERSIRESTYSIVLRGLKDWTQVLYQLGLTAAAINTLK